MDRYIKAMEIGNRYENEGISYFELLELLEKEYKFTYHSEYTFCMWFIENFSSTYPIYIKDRVTSYLRKKYFDYKDSDAKIRALNEANKILNNKWFLKGEASKQYIDYLELVEARQSSKKALKKADESIILARKSTNYALGALIISAVVSIVSIILSVMSYNKPEPLYPAPPYDVNLNKPVKLDDESIDKIKTIVNDSL